MLYILMWIIHIVSEGLRKPEPTPYKTEEERLAYLKEEERKRKQQRREWHENWINVERPRLIREAGLDPNNPEDVKVWKAQRKAEKKRKREAEMEQHQHTNYGSYTYPDSYSSDTNSSPGYEMSDDELERFMERESNKGPVEKFIDFLLWTP